MYYPIVVEDVSADAMRSGLPNEWVEIISQPGRTNLSHEERTDGWLGTTNDVYECAIGEFETLEAAREELQTRGYIPQDEVHEDVDIPEPQYSDECVERWFEEDWAYAHWDAENWLYANEDTVRAQVDELGVDDAARYYETDAEEQGVRLHGTEDYLQSLVAEEV